jgi:tetratricopeptide (TPR) repeat protein
MSSLEDDIRSLYEAGKYMTAYRRLEELGGLSALQGVAGEAIAGRLARNLGGDRYGSSLHLRAWRKMPDVEVLGFYIVLEIAKQRGAVEGLQFCESLPTAGLSETGHADLLTAKCQLLMALRDFARAEEAMDRASALAPDRPWMAVVRGHLLTAQDRPLEGLALHQRALATHPYFRPAVQSAADSLTQLNRVDEALALLTDAASHLESGAIYLQMSQLERDLERYESARERVRTAETLLPLADRDRGFRKGLAGMKALLACDLGEYDEAIELAKVADTPYLKGIAESLRENKDTGRRVLLNVGFTLQHEDTCVPATMATLTQYWDEPIEHTEIAQAICYDGTPAHAERAWLEKNGFYCREFTLTWDSARALIDAGIPFSQVLSGFRMGHMQAVIGYDSRKSVLLIRDPNVRSVSEYRANELLEAMRSSGPRGMAMVPLARRAELEAIPLPDVALWEQQYALAQCLDKHDRAGAAAACERMAALDAEHRLTTFARARLASYDGNRDMLRQCTDTLLAEFPTDQNQWAYKLSLLRENGTREQRLKVLSELSDKKDCETVFVQQYVDELMEDPATRGEAAYRLKRRLRRGDGDGQTLSLKARLLWMENRREEALAWFRYAACADGKDESRAMTYFFAARAVNRTDEVLAMIRDRFQRFRTRSGAPGRSLADALDQLCQPHKAVTVLEMALEARPVDGELKLFAADFFARIGRDEDARRQLVEAQPLCRAIDWQTASARLAVQQDRLEDAWTHIESSLAGDPLDITTHVLATQVLGDLRGPAAAVEHLRGYVARFPENRFLRTVLIEAVHPLGPETIEAETRAFLELHPQDAWGWRELGLCLGNLRSWQEAHKAAKRAHELEPTSEVTQVLLGMIYRGVGKLDKAREFFHKGIQLSADSVFAINELMKLCDTQEERRQELTRVFAELKRQVVNGQSLHAVREHAAATLTPAETLRLLLEARQSRSDLWQTWSVVVRQLLAMERHDDALKAASSGASRFPLLPVMLLDLADVYRVMGDGGKERAAINRALAVNSRDGATLRRSAEAHERAGDAIQEGEALERACQSEPRDVTHRGALADFFWRQGRRDEALATMREAVEREPMYEWGWRQYAGWSRVMGEPKGVVALADAITATHTTSPARWLQRARVLAPFPEHYNDCLQALERAIKLDPRNVDAHELRAITLAENGDFDAALKACQPAVFAARQPLQLASRAAIVLRQRGKVDEAVVAMRNVVEQDPKYAFAWAQLTEWHDAAGDAEESLECAKRLRDAAPDSATSWGYVAGALLATGEGQEARRHLQKAIAIDSSYAWAGLTLIQLDVEDEKFNDAIKTLQTIGPHLAEDERHARHVELACLAGRPKESLEMFRALCRGRVNGFDQLEAAMNSLLKRGQTNQTREIVLTELEREGHSPLLAAAAAELAAREADFGALDELFDWLAPGVDWDAGMAAFVRALGEAQATAKLCDVLRSHGERLRANGGTWAAVGLALARCGLADDCRQWMRDWRDRPETDGRALAALVESLVTAEEIDEAAAVVAHGDTLPAGPDIDALRLAGACVEIAQDNLAGAAGRIDSVRTGNLDRAGVRVYEVVRLATEYAGTIERRGPWRELKKAWTAQRAAVDRSAPEDYLRCVVAHCELMLAERSPNWLTPIVRKPLLRRAMRKRRAEAAKRPRALAAAR